MKITVDIPRRELRDAVRFTGRETKLEAIVAAVAEFNQRMRMAELAQHAGTCANLITPRELQALRRQG